MSNVFPMTGSSAFRAPTTQRDIRDRQQLGTLARRDPDALQAMVATEAPRVPWDVFYDRFNWQQGEHVALVGPTEAGKTSLLIRILEKRTFVAVTATKPRDSTMDHLISHGYQRFEKWESVSPTKVPRRVIWPDATSIDSEVEQRRVFRDMFAKIYREGGWALVNDEGYVMAEMLKLKPEMRAMWTQGRSLGISFCVATQRPRWVPLEMYDQSKHLFFWQNNDQRSLDTLGDINRRSSALVKEIIVHLEQYQVLYVNARSGEMMRTRPPAPGFDTTGR